MVGQGCCWFTVTFVYLGALGALSQNRIEEKTSFEAAFQGRCGHGSPCEQFCYELHDGMYECDCTDGYVLQKNGYSCVEVNSTSAPSDQLGEFVNDVENDQLNTDADNQENAVEDILYMRGASFTIHLNEKLESSTGVGITDDSKKTNEIPRSSPVVSSTRIETAAFQPQIGSTRSPEEKRESDVIPTEKYNRATVNIDSTCSLDCGPAGNCNLERPRREDDGEENSIQSDNRHRSANEGRDGEERAETSLYFRQRCQCPLGKSGDRCELETDVKSPRFSGSGWLAFPALRAAYKHVQLDLEFRPEAWDGILLLAGERDDLQGDFMALILHHGFLEFRFDCGSGVGVVRSTETVKLNNWNTLSVYRHRWDAWIQLNQAKRVQGRSKGLFSRITFREPLFVGGPGNTTGLERLPVSVGFRGCVRHLEANEHRYRFPLAPQGDAINGFDVEECTADRCSKVPCSHGGKCLATGGDTAVCLCPLGYTGDLCETRVDLQVPSFNGSSYLRYPGLAETSLSWLELMVTLKPTAPDGVILYNGHQSDATGDFIALYLSAGHIQFTFDLGTGPATLRSESPVRLGEWLEVRISRTGRLASLEMEDDRPQEVLAPGAFTQLSLPLNLYLGGAPSSDMYTPKIKTTASFVGCIQTVLLNHREVGILAEALGGVNVGNCGHACEARPCGDAECRPLRERFTCRCHPGVPHPCPASSLTPSSMSSFVDATISDDNDDDDENRISKNDKNRERIISNGYSPMGYSRSSFAAVSNSGNRHTWIPAYETKLDIPSFSGIESYLHYNDADTMKRIISYRVDINMRFRTSSSTGLLLWSGRHPDPPEQQNANDDFLVLGLNDGYLTLAYNLGSGEAKLGHNITRLDDDLWHRVRAVRNEQCASLVVDGGTGVSASSPGQLRQLNTDTGLYVGGAPDIVRTTGGRYSRGIVGCISDLVLDSDFSVALSSPEQSTNTHSCIP